MQDRFRYRVFDNDDKKMHDVIFLNYENNSVEWYNDKNKKRAAFIKEVPTVQCTSLKDKNGKLIYEGDILRNTLTNKYASVAWHNTGAGYVWSKTIPNSYLYEFGALFRVFGKYEVIGNIYENPELLEQL